MKKTAYLIIFCLLSFLNVFSQNGVGFVPVNLGVNVNTAEYDEFNAVLSPDGKQLYFNRKNHPENNYGVNDSQDVWYSELQDDGTWSKARHLSNYINSGRYNAVLAISQDGRMFINGWHTIGGIRYKNGITITKRVGEELADPEKMKVRALRRISEGRSFNMTLNKDATKMIIACTKAFNRKKLFLRYSESMMNANKWTKPKKIIGGINDVKMNEAPSLSPDDKILYFSSKREGGKGGFDIYKSSLTGENWLTDFTDPVLAFPDTVTSPEYESYFKVVGNGNFAYFTSTKGSLGGADIFKVKIKEDRPYILMTGYVVNANTGEKMTNLKDYKIMVNEKYADSVKINYDSAKYQLKLPFAKKYNIKAVVKNYTSIPVVYDATKINEYKEVKQDLALLPWTYVIVSGTFIDKASGLLIPGTTNPKLIVNGVENDTAKIDLGTSSYKIKLPHGKDYTLGVKAVKYNPITDTLSLYKVKSYQEITKPLFADKIPDPIAVVTVASKAIITGKVIDKKTGKPLASDVVYSVLVDGRSDIPISINPATAEYTIEAPPGTTYVLSAKAEKYYPISEVVDLSKEKGNIKLIKDLIVAPIEVGQTIRINNIYFETGKAVLKPTSFPELDKLTKFLKENPTIVVEVVGHTDNVGKLDKNLQLSRWRARAVEQYLEKNGVAANSVSFNGFGSTKPIASNKTPAGKAQNRRVEFVIKGVN